MTKREEPQEPQETALSDFHKLVSTFFKSHYSRLKPKIVYYRNYKNDVISGGSQGSVVGPILFNVFFNDFFYLSIMPQFITLLTITHFQISQKLLTN